VAYRPAFTPCDEIHAVPLLLQQKPVRVLCLCSVGQASDDGGQIGTVRATYVCVLHSGRLVSWAQPR
jgi:hypothetical protein